MENARKKMEEDEKKAEHMKAKYKTYTKGHEKRAETVWSQIEASLKQIEIGGTEVECFKALKRQEEMAASFRKKNLEEEVVKQKETERRLQARYGELLSTLEKAEELMVGFRAQALKQTDVVEDSLNQKEAKLATGEEEDVAISMEASA
ncbi:hypothetical protein BRARA_F00631 [Brassica rapa]|nr:hypothetical protein BRARA_F00631 [Brassica rapa]